jgi:hypothetical protein
MRPNDASARAAFRRCSPIAWRSASSAALALVLLAACGSTAGTGGSVSPSPSTRSIAFTEVAATSQARDDSGEMLIVGMTNASRATISQLVPNVTAPSGRVLVAVFQGQQNTGGYSVQITGIERSGDQLTVRATFGVPGPGAMVTQVLTSPAHVVSIAATDATGVREAILIDDAGVEHVRINTT